MKTVPGYPHLHRRQSGTYYYRRRVPDHLREVFGLEWKESLRTSEFEEAKRLCRRRGVEVDNLIQAAEAKAAGVKSPPLTLDEAKRLAAGWLAELLRDDEDARLSLGKDFHQFQTYVLEATTGNARKQLAEGDWGSFAEIADGILTATGRFYPPRDPSLIMLAGELLKADVQFHDAVAKRQVGEVVETPPVPAALPAAPRETARRMRDLIADYRKDKEKKHGEQWVQKRYSHIFAALEEIVGPDKPLAEIMPADCKAVRDFLSEVPASASKKYPKLSLREAVEAGRRDGAPLLAPNSVTSYMQNLSAMFNWDVKMWRMTRNPAAGLAEKGEATVKRRGYEDAELRTVFAALRSETPSRYWITALSLYSGGRLNEFCQLAASDIGEADGIAFIDFSLFDADTGERLPDRSLKTDASDRRIPIHSELIEAGFLTFVHGVRERGGGRLFPDQKVGPDGKNYGHGFSKWYGLFMDRIGLTQKSLVFHSYRHGFRDLCREFEIAEETADALGGWATLGVGRKYGDRGKLRFLSRASKKIHFSDFRLTDFPAPDACPPKPTRRTPKAPREEAA